MPSRRLAEKAVERFGLLQVHGFPAPTHVQLPLELAPPKGGERPAALRPRNGAPPVGSAKRNCAALPSLVSRRNPRAGLVASRQTFVRRRHLWTPLNPAAPRDDKRTM